ncbi:MAG: hypothetical protein MJ175_09245 [Clostridia bacterium]|nr:hypothetical protein [Clostridia bacterium]
MRAERNKPRRVAIFCGHYGSGKTNIAVNYALYLKKCGNPVRIADLDIVNPYFRTKDSMKELEAAGIPLISSNYANSNVDLPALPAELYSLVQQKNTFAVFDVGGDDRGAYALGRYRPYILEEDDFEMIYVVNFCRPLTPTPEDAVEVMNEITAASGIPFTAIINNTNLAHATTPELIRDSVRQTDKLSELTGLPVLMTTVREDLAPSLSDIPDLFPLALQKQYFEINE